MVQTPPSLADLLADDMGNLRPEAVEILRTMRPQRVHRRVRPREVHEDRRQSWRWLFAVFVLALSIIIIAEVLKEFNHRISVAAVNHNFSEGNIKQVKRPTYPQAHIQRNQRTGHRPAEVKINANWMKQKEHNTLSAVSKAPKALAKQGEQLSQGKAMAKITASRSSDHPMVLDRNPQKVDVGPANKARHNTGGSKSAQKQILGKAVVFGFKVNIRRYPRLGSHIIRQTNQGEVFAARAFARGWFEIELKGGQTAYIFGAYLLPMNFQLASHFVGLDQNKTKLLLAADHNPGRFQVIRPDGTKHYIRKSDVQIIKY